MEATPLQTKRPPNLNIGTGPRPCFCCGSDRHGWMTCSKRKPGRCAVCGSQEHYARICSKRFFPALGTRVNFIDGPDPLTISNNVPWELSGRYPGAVQLDSGSGRQEGIIPNHSGIFPEGNVVLPNPCSQPISEPIVAGSALPLSTPEESLRLPPTIMNIQKPGEEVPDHVISNLENDGDQSRPLEEENLTPGIEIMVLEPHLHRTLEPRWSTLIWLLKEENPRAVVIPAVGNFLKTRRLVYPAQLDRIETSVLLDTGANTSFVSDRFVEQSGFNKTENSEPFSLALFVGEAPTWITPLRSHLGCPARTPPDIMDLLYH